MTHRMQRGINFDSEGSAGVGFNLAPSDPEIHGSPATTGDETRKKVRMLERKLESQFDSLNDDEDTDYTLTRLREIDTMIRQLQDLNRLMASQTSSISLQNHQEKLRQYIQTYQRIKNKVDEQRARAALFQNTTASEGPSDISLTMQTLLKDRESLMTSSRNTTDLISQGHEIRATIERGRRMLENRLSGLRDTVGEFSSIDGAMNVIRRAKIKNTVIIGLVIAFGTCFLIWWAISR